ncbi:PAS domain S-box protein [Parapedobacter deserti]|uniref:histidine kinase n=1 Tax=Parapedobacter deserti TaxID=1912957 RepID=A0ABV7JSE9_9SPHI
MGKNTRNNAIDEQLKITADAAPVLMWGASADKRRYVFNASWFHFTGRSLEQEQGDGWMDGVHADDLERCVAIFSAAFDAQDAFKIEYRLRRHDGVYRWVLENGAPRYLADGTFAGYVGSCTDIHDLVKSTYAATLSASMAPPTTQVDEGLEDLAARNQELEAKVRTRTEALAESEQLLYAMNEELTAANEELAATNEELIATNEELRTANEDLAESEFKTRSIIANAPFPIAVYSGREMRIVEANQAIINVWGKGDDIIGKRYAEVLPELSGQNVYEKLDAVFTTGMPFHTRNQRVDLDIAGVRKTFYFNYSFTPLKDRSGKVYGVMNTAADVTDVVLAKQQVEHSQRMLYNLILQAPVAMCFMRGPEHVVEVANTMMFELWGKPEADVLQRPIFDGLPDARGQGLEQRLDHVYRTGETFRANEQPVMLFRNGRIETVYQNFVYQAYRDNHGEIVGVIAITNDVSAQVIAKIETQKAFDQLRLSKEAAQLGMFDLDIASGRLELDERCREMFGVDHDGPLSYEDDFVRGLHPDDRGRVLAALNDAMDKPKTDGNFDVEYRTVGLEDSQMHWIRAKGNVYFDPQGNPVRLIGSVIDITEQKLNEFRLKESIERKARLAAIVETSDDAIVSKTLQGIITSWNKSAERMLGYTAEEAIGKHISLIIPPSRLQEEDYIIGEIKAGKRVDHFDTIRLTKDGREIPLSITVSPLIDDDGRIIGASKIARDISAQVAAREAARRYTERLEIVNSMVESISEDLDLNKILQKVTDGTTALVGAKFGAFFYIKRDEKGKSIVLHALSGASKEIFEALGMPRDTAVLHPTFAGEGAIRVDDITKDARYGNNPPHYGMPSGHLPVVSYLAVPVSSRSGEVIGGLFLGHPEAGKFTADHEQIVTAIATQAAIGLDNAKLYAEVTALSDKKDEFIGLASHELKTPLTSAYAYMQILARRPAGPKSGLYIEKALRQMKKLATLVNDLLDISKIEAGKLQLNITEFDLKKLTVETIELIADTYSEYRIIFETAVDACVLNSDAQRVEQVLVNLLTNAIKYSPDSYEVKVTLDCTDEEVKVGVQDFGRGIAAEELPRVFTKFYRITDGGPNVSGLGIGLYLSAEIINRLNGRLWAESKLDEGSTFWFTLPLTSN